MDSSSYQSTPAIKNVRFGYSILSPMKQQKSTFNSYMYNLFPDVNRIQNTVNMLLIVHILRFPPSRLARKDILQKWTKACSVGVQIRGCSHFVGLSVCQLQTNV